MKNNPFSCNNSFCMSLDKRTRTILCKNRIRFNLKKKQDLLFNIGEGQLFLIEKGNLITIKQREDGKQIGFEILTSGDFFGPVQVFNPSISRFTVAYPINAVQGCMFSKETIKPLIKYPDFSAAIIKNLSIRLSNCIDHIEHLALDNSREKVAYILKKIKETTGTLQCTHEEIDMLVGMSRVTVTREIGKIPTRVIS